MHIVPRKGETAQIPNTFSLIFRPPVCIPFYSGHLCGIALFTAKQVVLYSSKVIMIQVSMTSLMMFVMFSRWSPWYISLNRRAGMPLFCLSVIDCHSFYSVARLQYFEDLSISSYYFGLPANMKSDP